MSGVIKDILQACIGRIPATIPSYGPLYNERKLWVSCFARSQRRCGNSAHLPNDLRVGLGRRESERINHREEYNLWGKVNAT